MLLYFALVCYLIVRFVNEALDQEQMILLFIKTRLDFYSLGRIVVKYFWIVAKFHSQKEAQVIYIFRNAPLLWLLAITIYTLTGKFVQRYEFFSKVKWF